MLMYPKFLFRPCFVMVQGLRKTLAHCSLPVRPRDIGTFFLDLKLASSAEKLVRRNQSAVVDTWFTESYDVG